MSIGAIGSGGPDFSSLRAQFQEAAAAKFKESDTDQSGGLSLDEFSKAHESSLLGSANSAGRPSVEEVFSKLDGDGDGEVTEAEFSAAKPPTPAGGFSPEAFAGLLSAQEDTGSNAILNLLSASAEPESGSASDLVGQLLEALEDTGEAEKSDKA